MWATILLTTGLFAMTSRLEPTHLKCEFQDSPFGIENPAPRLSWWVESSDRGARQTAYRVLVATTLSELEKGRGNVWDSGKVKSRESSVEYDGRFPTPAARCFWKVQLWDGEDHVSKWSPTQTWTFGPLGWEGQWIGADVMPAGNPAIMLRSKFTVPKLVSRATAYLCGLGYSELSINGSKVGDHVLDPGFTDYDRRRLFVSFDVSDQVKRGDNGIGILLGGGWFNLATPDLFGFEKAPWSAAPRALLNLVIDYADGTQEIIATDNFWQWSTGEITFNCVRGGETIDARRAQAGWSTAEFNAKDWHPVAVVDAPKVRFHTQDHPPIRAHAEVKAVKLTEPKPGVYVFDLGVNIAGWARLAARGPAGTSIKLGYNEKLNPDGTVNMKHASSHTYGRFQTDEFILAGTGTESFEPRFTYHGFRYVQVTGLPSPPNLGDLVGRWVTTDPESAGEFECSDPRINDLQTVMRRSFLNNMHGIPTDCPQREKMGWMDDGCVDMEAIFYNFDTPNFYRKWIGDMLDAQEPNGHVSDIVPTNGWGKSKDGKSPGEMADPWWGGAIVMAPWKHYAHYADLRILEQSYAGMKRYVDFMTSTAVDHRIAWGLGDWLDDSAGGGGRRAPVELTSSAAYYHCADIVGRSARLLGKSADAQAYTKLATQIAESLNAKFLDATTGKYANDSQTAQAIPLVVGLVPHALKDKVEKQLVASVEDRNGHISSGIVGSPYVFRALMEMGRDDLAWKLMSREDYPGWLHMLKSGATALWEDWKGENSLDHPTLGAVGFWLYEGLAGIRPGSPGFASAVIQPAFVDGLDWVRASHTTVRGVIRSSWKRDGKIIELTVTIPANMTATVVLPGDVLESGKPVKGSVVNGRTRIQIESGTYVFKVSGVG